ncbi:putative membrane protein [Catenulispora sp. GP43]|uniref:ferritin-like domain-containing protein n=1 Tax=Catenulispora sp. GP43 TaxID=3156263 RepID=UPI003515E66E
MSGPSRRVFTFGIAGIAGLTVGGCGGGGHGHSKSRGASGTTPSPYTGDLRTAALAAAVENQAVSAYQGVDAALRAGKYGPAVPGLAAFVQTAMAHHTEHAASWNNVLRGAGKPVVVGSPLSGHALTAAIGAATSADAVVAALQNLEVQASQTYIAAVGRLSGSSAIAVSAATIAPVEAMHAAALAYAFTGRSAVGEALGTVGAVPVTALTV